MNCAYYKTNIGIIKIGYTDKVNHVSLVFDDLENLKSVESDISLECINEINEYLEGKRKKFTVSYYFSGTPFQNKVWSELVRIPYGETVSYKDIAKKINSKAYRAIGTCISHNPLFIIIPCHRVIKANGNVGGFFYKGDLKEKLLLLEKNNSIKN